MKYQLNNYPSLTKSYKGLYPFKICTTSFIYPDHYIANVRMLGPFMDEIELLVFESQGLDVLLSGTVIDELGRLGEEFELSYNVHLPTDISITDPDPARQRQAAETMIRIIKRVRPLDPSALILHLPYAEKLYGRGILASWRDRVLQNLRKIKSEIGIQDIIAVETLDYPLEMVGDIILDLDLMICLDLGHLMVYEFNLIEVFNTYRANTAVLHLHGIENGRDHTALDRLAEPYASTVLRILKRFTGVVSLEVFSFENLRSSLKFIETRWDKS
jgi:sugar phosphate isomerase/epimerase